MKEKLNCSVFSKNNNSKHRKRDKTVEIVVYYLVVSVAIGTSHFRVFSISALIWGIVSYKKELSKLLQHKKY